jgi:UV DNA damage endonuclease
MNNNNPCRIKYLDMVYLIGKSQLTYLFNTTICEFNWIKVFREEFESIGNFVNNSNMRISMHPGQYVLLNAKDEKIRFRSIGELMYHCILLDSLGLDESAKILIHVGGAYGDKVQD